ncbi:glutamate-5-semialdehyde dehydrogenase [Pelotomaculum isophthalicicum JI]|uniref:Gamma-glutamyl phosphate reductase n=1 Tax=Pelotomaculum isophthalicicum JI TaxID=947010 RepID=A0A9X4JUF2_9FIRM|nr:glutamate-5-semialdehyde dehydrogenase [Pelotomaculum isophthalicicum]MDF9409085.1 glutamate-5-semialdehyde dehydrogenase [Pelotomaculum isophthalicicum JI]
MEINEIARQVKEASIKMAAMSADLKNRALEQIAGSLIDRQSEIIKANDEDLNRSAKENLPEPLLKRLKFDETKIADVVDGINSLINLPDPVGKTLLATELDEGLELYKTTCPIGVIGVIFESRPDALVQISTLCLKSGNCVLLKGGSEAKETNRVLADIIIEATKEAGIPADWLKLLETRAEVDEMLKLDEHIDLIIPRGSNDFVRYIMDHSSIPVMGHADGICHCYVDEDADLEMAVRIVDDSKTQYVAVCNATETLLVHEKAAPGFLPLLKEALEKKDVAISGCPRTMEIIPVSLATEEDWGTEYLDYKLSIKIVKDIDEAINHINHYGSGHTDSVITGSKEKAARFMALVDSGNVFWNCSTRFSDGFRYGFGAEVGISTSKIHARGPVGLEGLVIYKYNLIGNGHIVAEYANRDKTFKHKKMNKEFPL